VTDEGLELPEILGERTFRVFRFARGDEAPRYEEFAGVPVHAGSTVLESLRWIQVHRDPTLGIRHSCFHASCGTCGLRVNGVEGLACVTPAAGLRVGPITVEPMANIPVLHDLVVDMDDFTARFPARHPLLRRDETAAGAQVPDGLDAFERFEDCIECGLCLSACPVAATDDRYLGPAALAWAQRLVEEPREAEPRDLLAWAGQEHGAFQCHASFECTAACPSDVFPAERIMKLRRELTVRGLRGPQEAGA
jgi:succinate dehydrogenase / fumarate reductase iron-sulfur subunit